MLSYYQTVAGDWRYLTRYDQALAGLTAADLQAAARRNGVVIDGEKGPARHAGSAARFRKAG